MKLELVCKNNSQHSFILVDCQFYLFLGRIQASSTGERLKVLGYPFNKIHVSTMTRAIETAQLISESLPDVPVEQCALLEEGAPVPPDPPVGHWKPEVYVS